MSKRLKLINVSTSSSLLETILNEERRMIKKMNDNFERSRRETKNQIKISIDTLHQNLNEKLSTAISGVNSRVNQFDENHRKALRSEIERVDRDIAKNAGQASNQIDGVRKELLNKTDKIEKTIDNVRNDLRNQQEQISEIYGKFVDEDKCADMLIEDLKKFRDIVNERSAHKKFAHEEWREIREGIDAILKNRFVPTSVITNATIYINKIFEFEKATLKKQLEFEKEYCCAIETVEELLKMMKENETTSIADVNKEGQNIPDENNKEIRHEVDHWTNGEYNKLEKKLDDYKNYLVDNRDLPEFTVDNVKKIISSMDSTGDKLRELVIQAVCNVRASQIRAEAAEKIVITLRKSGYNLLKKRETVNEISQGTDNNNQGYAFNYRGSEDKDCDNREGLYAICKNGNGTEITILVDKGCIKDDPYGLKLSFHRNNNDDMTAREYRSSLESIKAIIETSGYELGDLQEPREGSDGDTIRQELTDPIALEKAKRQQQTT